MATVKISDRKHLTWELEAKMKARIEWQNDKKQEAAEVYGRSSLQVQRLDAYVDALRWVLKEAGCTEVRAE
jgi:hypothetical protein